MANPSVKYKDLGLVLPSAGSTDSFLPSVTHGSLPGAGPAEPEPADKFLDMGKWPRLPGT